MVTATPVVTCTLLNELIVACHDEHRVQREAAEFTSGHDARLELRRSASQRHDFATELGTVVRSLGGSPATKGSVKEGLFAVANRIGGRILGEDERRRVHACARVEAKLDALYERALSEKLPDRARVTLLRQWTVLRDERLALHRLRAPS